MSQIKKSIGYCDFINFRSKLIDNPQLLWKQHKSTQKTVRTFRKNKPYFAQYQPSQQSSLEQSALLRVRSDKKRYENNVIEDYLSRTTSSNFLLSRQNTQQNLQINKKKNRPKTSTQDMLFNVIDDKIKDEKFDDLILYPHLVGLSQLVYAQVMGKQRKINKNLLNSWKCCLLPQDNEQVYGSNAPYTVSRIFPINELQEGLNDIFGRGKKRCLRMGQEALLIHHMMKYLQKCQKKITRIARRQYDIIPDILKSAKLQQLQSMQICMKQIQLIWKIIATQWKYSGKLQKNNRFIQNALFNGKSNFIDLRKQNNITNFLLVQSNRANIKQQIGVTRTTNMNRQQQN